MEALPSSSSILISILLYAMTIEGQDNASHYFTLNIIHTTSLLSNIDPVDSRNVRCVSSLVDCFGGGTRVSSFVDKIRDNNENVLLLDGGDALSSNIWYHFHEGQEMSSFMNSLKYDAVVLGCNDFPLYGKFLENLRVPILFSNLNSATDTSAAFGSIRKEPLILTMEERQIGIFGYTKNCSAFDEMGVQISGDEVIAERVEFLKTRNVGIIILISHESMAVNEKIAQAHPDIDVIVGGGKEFLYSGKPPGLDEVSGPYPIITLWKTKVSASLLVYSGAYGKYVGFIKVEFALKGQILYWEGNPVFMGDKYRIGMSFRRPYRLLLQPIKVISKKVIGHSMDTLEGADVCTKRECTMGDLVCDSVVDTAASTGFHCHTCATLGNTVMSSLPEGEITEYDVAVLLPLNQSFIAVKMNGSTLTKLFEASIKDYHEEGRSDTFLQTSG